MNRSTFLRHAMAAAITALCASAATAQTAAWPSRPVTLVVPFPAGGSVDLTARVLAQKLSIEWQQPVVVDNRSGAAGTIGTSSVARAQADGYTLLMGSIGPNALTPAAKPVPYNALKDLTPIAKVISQPTFLMVKVGGPYRDINELIAAGKSNAQLNYASAGVGSVSNFASELFNFAAGTRFQHIPYRGTAPALQAMYAGETAFYFAPGIDAIAPVKSGQLRPLLVTSLQRSKVFPDVPTVSEIGLKEPRIDSWYGVFGPANMPEPLVNQINASIQNVFKDSEFRTRLEGSEVSPGSAKQFAELLASDFARLQQFVKQTNFKPD